MTIALGLRLAELRRQHGYSQEELADKLGVSRQAVSKWERGEASPDTDNLIELAKIYNMSLDDLLNLDPTKPDEDFVDGISNPFKPGIHIQDDDGSSVHIQEDGIHIQEDGETVHVGAGDFGSKEPCFKHSTEGRVSTFISLFTTIGTVIAYILLGSILNLWSQAWVLFLLIPVIPGFVNAIMKRNINIFPYPVFITFIFLLLCVWIFNFNNWHPLWVVFLSIPVYYAFINIFKKGK